MPEGTVSGPARPARAVPDRLRRVIALRTGAPIVPLAMAGTEELYLGRRMASRVLPVDVGARAPGAVSRRTRRCRRTARARSSSSRARMTEPLAALLGPGGRGAPPVDGRPAGASAPAASRLTWLLLRPGRLDRDGLDAALGRRAPVSSAAMQYAESILDLVGDTPLVRISRASRATSARPSASRSCSPSSRCSTRAAR